MSDNIQEIIKLKSELRTNWRVLKDEKMNLKDRKAAYENINDISEHIKEIDNTFEVIDLKNTQWNWIPSGKKPEGDNPDIKWPIIEGSFGVDEEKILDNWTAVAFRMVKKQHPKLSEDTDKFGQIVNAKISHLISISNGKLI